MGVMKVERQGSVAVVHMDPDYSGLNEKLLEQTESELLTLIEAETPPLIVLDLAPTNFFGSNFIEILVRIWHRVSKRGGKMALAAMQPFCLEILRTARLDSLWPVTASVPAGIHLVQPA